jgi:hypothetical protein
MGVNMIEVLLFMNETRIRKFLKNAFIGKKE